MDIAWAPQGCEISISGDPDHQDFISKEGSTATIPVGLLRGIATPADGREVSSATGSLGCNPPCTLLVAAHSAEQAGSGHPIRSEDVSPRGGPHSLTYTSTARHHAPLACYLTFCRVRRRFENSGRLYLDEDFVFPTTLLPLAVLCAHTGASLTASNPAVQGYADWIMTTNTPPPGGTYVPIVRLPSKAAEYP